MDIRYLIPVGFLLATPLAYAAPPVANPDTRPIPTGVSVTINVLANDSDPDGDGLRVIDDIGQPENATVTVNPDGGSHIVPHPGVGAEVPEPIEFI